MLSGAWRTLMQTQELDMVVRCPCCAIRGFKATCACCRGTGGVVYAKRDMIGMRRFPDDEKGRADLETFLTVKG